MTVYNFITDFGAVGDGVTDDAGAFVRMGDALDGTSGNDVIFPAGNFKCFSNGDQGTGRILGATLSGKSFLDGVVQCRMLGAGAGSTTIDFNGWGAHLIAKGQKQNGNNFAKIASVSSGSTTATLLDASKASLFAVNQWVLVSGLNIQDIYSPVAATGYGYPANLTVFEFIKITGISGTTITFDTALTKSYLSTWPEQNSGGGFEVNSGGPAGIYSLPISWDADVLYDAMTISTPSGQIYANGRRAVFTDCIFPGGGPVPSQNDYWEANNCTHTATIIEVDKLVNQMVVTGGTWKRFEFQSSSVNTMSMTNATMEATVGTAIDSTISGCTFTDSVTPGCFIYGICGSLTIDNCSIPSWGAGGTNSSYAMINRPEKAGTMSGGIIAVPNGTTVSNITDNGSGKCRYTVLSSGGYTAGKYTPVGAATQELTTTATASSGTNVLTFASVPAWITNGQAVLGVSNGYTKIPNGTTVTGTTATTITLSNNVTSNIVIGDKLALRPSGLSAGAFDTPKQILSIVDGTTIDIDIAFPSGFVYTYGASLNPGSALSWAIPGKYLYWSGSAGRSRTFKILGVTQDADKTYVQTNETGGFPTIPIGANLTEVSTPGAQRIYATNLTGASPDNANLMDPKAQGKPFGSYVKRTYTGSDSAAVTNGRTVFGNLVAITIDVQQAYTGAQANLFLHLSRFDNQSFLIDGVQANLGWGIDVRTVGTRIITPANTVTNATKQPNDGPLLIPAWTSSVWINSATSMFLKNTASLGGGTAIDISGEASNLWPIVVVEIETDQGFVFTPTAVMPLRFRLRAA
jgi:hypothetical protein